MNRYWLIVKVFVLHIFQYFKILPNVWYRCELDLAKINGKRMADFFKKYEFER